MNEEEEITKEINELRQMNAQYCLYGWKTPPKGPQTYNGGCGCWLPLGHEGKCVCGEDAFCKDKRQRPASWDKQRKVTNERI